MANVTPAKNIKIKAVVGNPSVAIRKAVERKELDTDSAGEVVDGQSIVLGYIYGRCTETFMHKRNVPQPGGDVKVEQWPALKGDFECTSIDGNTIHRAPVAFLQEHYIDMIGNTLKDARDAGEVDPVLEIAFEIQAITSHQGSAGFEWRLIPKMDLTPKADPLARLRAAATGKALPAPAAASETETEAGETVEGTATEVETKPASHKRR